VEFFKGSRSVTQTYTVVDGPVVDMDPNRLSKGRFRVEMVTVSWIDGNVTRVFVRGQAVLKDGSDGKYKHDRSYYGSDIPDWLDGILDISL